MAKAKKATRKVMKKEAVPAKTVLAATASVPPEPPKPSKKELAQKALDTLGAATPSVGSDGEVIIWLKAGENKIIEDCLVAIVNS